MHEYDFTEITKLNDRSILALLRELYQNLTEAQIERALVNQYRLFALRKESQLLGIAGIHSYPHLTDTKRAWIHDLITVNDQKSFEYKSVLLAQVRNRCFNPECPEIAIHVPVNNASENEFFIKEVGQPFALVYEWTNSSWATHSKQIYLTSDFRCSEMKTLEDLSSGLALLRHFHPAISETALTHATENGYRLFGLWLDDQLYSIATLIHYPHLTNGTCIWLQDGMALPIKRYKEAALSLFSYVMDSCFESGSLTVSVHARVKNKRIHRFYEEAGGYHIANAYKWKRTAETATSLPLARR